MYYICTKCNVGITKCTILARYWELSDLTKIMTWIAKGFVAHDTRPKVL